MKKKEPKTAFQRGPDAEYSRSSKLRKILQRWLQALEKKFFI